MAIKPPPQTSNASLVHKVSEFYKKVYLVGSKIPKRDKLGIHQKVENYSLEIFDLIIGASFETRENKLSYLKRARIRIESLKRLVRMENELHIITNEKYLELELDLQEISKMTNGWIKYLTTPI